MSVNIRISVTVPDSVLRSEFIRDQIMAKMQSKTAPDIKRLFGQTVNGWANKPDWSQRFTNSVDEVSTEVWPSGQHAAQYSIVNQGSPAHVIRPRNRGMLRFQVGYRRSTTPRVLSSRANSRYGDVVSSGMVRHPGFEARDFDAAIRDEYAPTFAEDMQEAIKVATVKRR